MTTLFACRDGRLCVGTQDGLWTLKSGQWTRITTQDGLSNNHITSIHEGQSGDLWVGTALGLNRIRDHSVRVFHVNDRTAIGPIGAVRCDRSGVVWVGTAGGELYRLIDEHSSIVENERTAAEDEINTIIEGREGSLWVATWNGGLTRWKDGAIEVFGPQDGLPQTEIFSLAEDRWGSIWIGTRKGLFVLPSSGRRPREDLASDERRRPSRCLRDREGYDLGRHFNRPRSIQRLASCTSTAKQQGLPDRNVASTLSRTQRGRLGGHQRRRPGPIPRRRIVASVRRRPGSSQRRCHVGLRVSRWNRLDRHLGSKACTSLTTQDHPRPCR